MKARPRLLALTSLFVFTSLILLYLWWGRFHYFYRWLRLGTYSVGILIVLGNHIYFKDDRRRLGLRLDNLKEAARLFAGPTLLACLIITVTGLVAGSSSLSNWHGLEDYLVWAVLQQHLLQNFLRLRSFDALGRSDSQRDFWLPILFAAALFSVFHLPNRPLLIGAFLVGLLWCILFTRSPNLLCSTVSQILITTTLLLFFKFDVFNQFKIGPAGYRFHYYGSGVKVGGGYDERGQPFIATVPSPDWVTRSQVKVFSADGKERASWTAFPQLRFSAEIAVGDVGFGPGDEIVLSPGPGEGNPPLIRVYSPEGKLLSDFAAPAVPGNFGAWVSTGCGTIWAFPGPAPRADQKMVQYDGSGNLLKELSFSDLPFVNGLRGTPLCAQVTNPGGQVREEPHSLVLWGTDVAVNPSTIYIHSLEDGSQRSFPTLATTFGLQASRIRLSQASTGIAAAPGPLHGYPALARVFDVDGRMQYELPPLQDPDAHGSHVGSVDVDGDGIDEILLGEGTGPNRPYRVRIYSLNGELLQEWEAY